MFTMVLATVAALGAADTTSGSVAGPRLEPVGIAIVGDTTPRKRPKAIEVSDDYSTRLKIHRIASYAMLPLSVTQYLAGTALYNADSKGEPRPQWATSIHRPMAYAIGALFLTNTVTGSMNWWETRDQEAGRAWRTLHAALMLASDAGFAYAGSIGTNAKFSYQDRDTHRKWATISLATAVTSYLLMLDPIRRDK